MTGFTFTLENYPTAEVNGNICWYRPRYLYRTMRNTAAGAAFLLLNQL